MNKHPYSWGRNLCDTKMGSRTALTVRLKVSQLALHHICLGYASHNSEGPLDTQQNGRNLQHRHHQVGVRMWSRTLIRCYGNANVHNHFVRQFSSYVIQQLCSLVLIQRSQTPTSIQKSCAQMFAPAVFIITHI